MGKDKEKKPKPKGKKLWKIVGGGGTAMAGVLTMNALEATWKTTTGKESPTKPENPDVRDWEALAWVAFSGAALAMAKVYVSRRMVQYWYKSFGELPPGIEITGDPKERAKVRKDMMKKA